MTQIVQSIAYARPHEVTAYWPLPAGKAHIGAANWTALPMHPASAEIATSSRSGDAGTSYATSLSARLRTDIRLPAAAILRLTLCSGKTLILGTPDIPVRMNKSTTLSITTLSASHIAPHQPLELAAP